MPTTSGWLGQGDTAGAYIASTVLYAGTNKQLGWVGQGDTAGAWLPNNKLLYAGTLKTISWLGQLDAAGAWIPTSLIYMNDNGSPAVIPPTPTNNFFGLVQVLAGGYLGMTWMKNVLVLPKEWWPDAQSQPYQGQLWPIPTTGQGNGQTYPY